MRFDLTWRRSNGNDACQADMSRKARLGGKKMAKRKKKKEEEEEEKKNVGSIWGVPLRASTCPA